MKDIRRRRRSFKRKSAFLLALSMVCSLPQAMNAEAVFSGIGISQKNRNTVLTVNKKTGASEKNAAGRINVILSSVLPLESKVTFTAKLIAPDGSSQEKPISVINAEEQQISFEKLATGDYTLEVNAPGFAVHRQTISVAQKLYSVSLTAGFFSGYNYETDPNTPGVIMVGDVNNDGLVDDKDRKILVDKIDGTAVGKNYTTDLNADGVTDLTDLTLFSNSYQKENLKKDAFIKESISPDMTETAVSENTSLGETTFEDFYAGKANLQLSTANNEPISQQNPVEVDFTFTGTKEETTVEGITLGLGASTSITQALIGVTYDDDKGEEHNAEVPFVEGISHYLIESNAYAVMDTNGNINVYFGAQVAVKKVSIKITGVKDNNNLAEISKVEFVNDMENRIAEPELDIPTNLKATAGSEQFTVTWNPCLNVKGYEVKIEQGTTSQTISTTSNSLTLTSFNNGDIKNYTTYKVSVQSTNDGWQSGFCKAVEVTPKPTKKPDKPDGVSASGGFKSIVVKWKSMDDTQSYNVFYRHRNSDEEYTQISDIKGTSYTISNLDSFTEYEMYVTGVNELGESPRSLPCSATTTEVGFANMPKYKLLNRDEEGNPSSTHIISATRNGGAMMYSPLDEGSNNSAWGTVDNDPESFYQKDTWNDGAWGNLGNNGLKYTFDKEYTIDSLSFWVPVGNSGYAYNKVKWWTEDGSMSEISNSRLTKITKNGKSYYMLQFPYPITAKTIQFGTANGSARTCTTSMGEVYFYLHDDFWDEIMSLYTDDLHTTLREDVTLEMIQELREKVNNLTDEYGEECIYKDSMNKELETAEKILNDQKLNKAITVYNTINTNEASFGFSGLNAWQPLGVSAAAGEEITVYVGHNERTTGMETNLVLVSTQYHSESGGVVAKTYNLNVGANKITLSKSDLASSGFEAGGALYVYYTGNNSNDKYSVRVSGGTKIPTLDLYKVTDENVRMERAVEYITELDEYVANMENLHNEIHSESENANVNYAYDEKNCILGASDIMLDTMMLSLPAKQMLSGTGSGTVEQRAENLLNSMKAMEDMMYLFYQHKGLNDDAPTALNQLPKGHLNIRYQRMFSGAFMYAAGNHIGIEWGSSPALMRGNPIVADEDGKYISGNYFGWGIAHEIGHNINQGAYTVAEITNNYFAQLAQAKDTNEGMRFQYQNIYNKVSSGTKGNCSNIATQLGMYWQLHLAYDTGLNYKTYADYNEQLANLFYARVDTYARNVNEAPAPKRIKLTLNGGTDQNLMRLACAASQKNVLEFFERWGKTPDATTIKYASQFPKETRAIFYANDDSRVYALNGSGSVLGTDCSVNAIGDVSVNIGRTANQVELGFTPQNIPSEDILGYEITRCTISGGKVEETPVGFSTNSTFTDTVTTMNNRAVFYKVTLIDQYLNRSASFTTKMVKIEHDGSMDKTNWSISTSGLTAEAVLNDATEEMPCEQTASNPAESALDNNLDTVYTPQITGGNEPIEIVIDFNKTLTATGLKYTAGAGNSDSAYEVYVMEDGKWIKTAGGKLNRSEIVYFANDDSQYISTYSATAVKIVIDGQQNETISIAEIDVLGATGDNVDFRRTEGENVTVIGTLSADYQYGQNSEDIIPEGSLVFTGSYKGNPAYNVVLLYDDNGNIVGGLDRDGNLLAQQIILADVPDNSNIANVSDGTWVYWIEPEQLSGMTMPENVRVELYRVNNALTNEGQRLVSDSLFEEVPDTLPEITFGK